MADRGAYDSIRFERAARGFVLFANPEPGLMGEMFAFDTIGGVAEWLMDQYGPPTPANCQHKNGGVADASKPEEAWCIDCGARM